MPQVFQVLRCYKCLVFQVHQVKKSNKWECKLCGEKQSVKRHYGIGTAKDCRLQVQNLNCIRGEINEIKKSRNENTDDELDDKIKEVPKANLKPIKSKWANYVDQTKDNKETSPEEPMYLGDKEVVLEISKKRKKSSFKCPSKAKRTTDSDEMFVAKSVDIYVSPKHHATNFEDPEELALNDESYHPDNSNVQLIGQKMPICGRRPPLTNVQKSIKVVCKNEVPGLQEIKGKVPIKPFIPPVVNSSSKWAQFVEEEDSPIEDNEFNVTSTTLDTECSPGTNNNCLNEVNTKCQNLFSLCNDGDLDSVLDI